MIVGGGFAGLAAARRLKGAPVRVVLVDRTNHHVFQPLLYQVAAGLSHTDITSPIRRVPRWLTFVVIGSGPTGVELAGAMVRPGAVA